MDHSIIYNGLSNVLDVINMLDSKDAETKRKLESVLKEVEECDIQDNSLNQVIKELTSIMEVKQIVSAPNAVFESVDDVKAAFNTALANCAAVEGNLKERVEKARERIEETDNAGSGSDDENNDSMQVLSMTYSRKDPITKADIQKPVKNKLCGHVYDRCSILRYVEDMKKKKRMAIIRCPHVSCPNRKNISESHLVDFPEFFKLCK